MTVTIYKVLAEEVGGTEQAYPIEIQMAASNTTFTPNTATATLTSNTADNANDGIVNASKINANIFVSGTTSTAATTSTSFIADTVLTATPPAGTWAIWASLDTNTTGANTQGDVELFVDGVGIGESLRSVAATTALLGIITLSTNAIRVPVTIVDKYTFTGTQVLSVRYRVNPATSGAGGFQLNSRTLLLMQVAL